MKYIIEHKSDSPRTSRVRNESPKKFVGMNHPKNLYKVTGVYNKEAPSKN